MAVYTSLTAPEIEQFLTNYRIGEYLSHNGIAEGVENSNYLLITRRNAQHERYILTLYEARIRRDELPYFVGLMRHLAKRGVNCPLPIDAADGEALQRLAGKDALIVSFLEGKGLRRTGNIELHALGVETARLHLAAADYPAHRQNDLAPDCLRALYAKIGARLDALEPGLHAAIGAELDAFDQWAKLELPIGTIHADLFPDNVFFIGDRLTGIIDFYFACSDYLAYDLAICLNAWCFEGNTDFNITKAKHLLQGYSSVRPLSAAELDTLPLLARGAAVRFLLTRAHDWFFPVDGALVTPKNPIEYMKKWQFHRQVATYRDYVL